MTLRWEPAPYRKRKDEVFADVPDGLGRYHIKWDKLIRAYNVRHNGALVATEPTLEDATKRAELGAALLLERHGSRK